MQQHKLYILQRKGRDLFQEEISTMGGSKGKVVESGQRRGTMGELGGGEL
jgi:hypothetical protein